jgi:2-acylglycerol O-acyltransferase 2
MKLLGIEFVPLCIPMHRRYEVLAAAGACLSFAIGGFLGFFMCLYLLFTRLWWLVLLYFAWIHLDRHTCENGGRSSVWVLNWRWWYHAKNYFPIDLDCVPGIGLNVKRNYLFCCFPHGVIPMGPFSALATPCNKFHKLYPEFIVKTAVLRQLFFLPFLRELALGMGMISCSANSLNYELSRPEGGHIVSLMPGGAMEAYYSQPGKYRFVIKNRKGFVKLALKNGSPLVPLISFGETDLFDQIDNRTLHKIQEFIRKYLGFAPVIFNGRGFFQYSFGMIPRRKPITTVVGTPIEVTKLENPTEEQIQELHDKFVQSLVALFEEYKHKYLENPEDQHLELQ